jgi:hypothetical protein
VQVAWIDAEAQRRQQLAELGMGYWQSCCHPVRTMMDFGSLYQRRATGKRMAARVPFAYTA